MDTAEYMSGFAQFISASPSSYHAAHEVARQLRDAGFTELHEHEPWVAPTRAFVIRDGAIIAWITPDDVSTTAPVRVLGSHTDSPGFKLKPQSTIGAAGWLQVGVEVYGGPLLNSWLDRELELAGRLVLTDGSEHLVRTGPFMRIPQLAIHLDREANKSLSLDKQRNTAPVYGVGEVGDADVLGYLADIAGVNAADVAGYDIISADTQEPRHFGRDNTLFAAGRMDNLSSVYAGLVALLGAPRALSTSVCSPRLTTKKSGPKPAQVRVGRSLLMCLTASMKGSAPPVKNDTVRSPNPGVCLLMLGILFTRITLTGTTLPCNRWRARVRC